MSSHQHQMDPWHSKYCFPTTLDYFIWFPIWGHSTIKACMLPHIISRFLSVNTAKQETITTDKEYCSLHSNSLFLSSFYSFRISLNGNLFKLHTDLNMDPMLNCQASEEIFFQLTTIKPFISKHNSPSIKKDNPFLFNWEMQNLWL